MATPDPGRRRSAPLGHVRHAHHGDLRPCRARERGLGRGRPACGGSAGRAAPGGLAHEQLTTTSEVARANRLAGHEDVALDPEVATVVDSSLQLWRESDGAFDITVEPLIRAWGFLGGPRRVPTTEAAAAAARRVGAQHVHYARATRTLRFDSDSIRIDLGGIAKGYAVENAAGALRDAGVRNALVDLTGNMAALGTPAGGRPLGHRSARSARSCPVLRKVAARPGRVYFDIREI
ncbi:MAG: FAD:protein FMN transferase [Candidatus Eisenbacteria bacterium]|nr:FAD:protein FMN transferase [Candidatus Eisenbacteria bacterium]